MQNQATFLSINCKKMSPSAPATSPEGMNDLALFTLGALDLATGKLGTSQRTVIRKCKGEPKPENLVETQVTTTENDEAALEEIRRGRTQPLNRPRVADYPRFNPGLLLQPRA